METVFFIGAVILLTTLVWLLQLSLPRQSHSAGRRADRARSIPA